MSEVLENQNSWGGPLKLRLCPPLAFSGFVPGPDDLVEEIKGFIHDTVLYPPWELPPGELKFFGRQFGYRALVHTIAPRRRGWIRAILEPWRIGEKPREEFWHCEDAAGYLEERFEEEWGWLIQEEPKIEAPPPALVAPAQIVAPLKTSKDVIGEPEMAEAMGIPVHVLHERLDRGMYWYKFKQCLVRWKKDVDHLGVLRTLVEEKEYLFSETDQEWNKRNVSRRRPQKRQHKEQQEPEPAGGGDD